MADGVHVVFGGGPLGLAVLRALEMRKLPARLVTRGGKPAGGAPAAFEWVSGDATNSESAHRACAGASVVYHCAGAPYNRWAELLPRMLMMASPAAPALRRRNSSTATTCTCTAGSPAACARICLNQIRARVRCARSPCRSPAWRRITGGFACHHRTRLGFFGPNVLLSHAGNRPFPPALAGKLTDVLGNADKLAHFHLHRRLRRALAVLGTRRSVGQAWHVPNAETLTIGLRRNESYRFGRRRTEAACRAALAGVDHGPFNRCRAK